MWKWTKSPTNFNYISVLLLHGYFTKIKHGRRVDVFCFKIFIYQLFKRMLKTESRVRTNITRYCAESLKNLENLVKVIFLFSVNTMSKQSLLYLQKFLRIRSLARRKLPPNSEKIVQS